ncbi:hypothetical protein H2204_014641 [Knufia peltigerae]|uniref:Uncharacterized protein n=1 Tax=Knufia peltigerae TaxID=1002370 RepID=A0AA38XHZ9_9EURO|nr:hypothetical protein H2204_014641 [Knufia peltigerae]
MQPSTEEPQMSLYERTQKSKQDLHKRNMAEHLAIATTYLWRVHLAQTNGGEQPESLEGCYLSAVDMLKFDLEHAGETIQELYRKNVLKTKKKPSRKTKSSKSKSKVSKEQARKKHLAQLKLEAEARLDARLSKNTIQEIGRNNDRQSSGGDNTLVRKRKLSDDSLNSSDSAKRHKSTGAQPITAKRKRDGEDDDSETKRHKSSAPEKVAAAKPKDTRVIAGKTNASHKKVPPFEATAPANKRKRANDEVDISGNEEVASNNTPAAKRIRSDHNDQSKVVKTPVAKKSATPPVLSTAAEALPKSGVSEKSTTPAVVAKPGPSNTDPKAKATEETDTTSSDQEGYRIGSNFVWRGGNQFRDKYKKKPLPPMMTKMVVVPKVNKPVFEPKKLLRLGYPSRTPSP